MPLCVVPTKSKKENLVPSGNWFGKNYAGALAGITVVGVVIIVALSLLVSIYSPFHSVYWFIAELHARVKRARGRSPIAKEIYPSQKIW